MPTAYCRFPIAVSRLLPVLDRDLLAVGADLGNPDDAGVVERVFSHDGLALSGPGDSDAEPFADREGAGGLDFEEDPAVGDVAGAGGGVAAGELAEDLAGADDGSARVPAALGGGGLGGSDDAGRGDGHEPTYRIGGGRAFVRIAGAGTGGR